MNQQPEEKKKKNTDSSFPGRNSFDEIARALNSTEDLIQSLNSADRLKEVIEKLNLPNIYLFEPKFTTEVSDSLKNHLERIKEAKNGLKPLLTIQQHDKVFEAIKAQEANFKVLAAESEWYVKLIKNIGEIATSNKKTNPGEVETNGVQSLVLFLNQIQILSESIHIKLCRAEISPCSHEIYEQVLTDIRLEHGFASDCLELLIRRANAPGQHNVNSPGFCRMWLRARMISNKLLRMELQIDSLLRQIFCG